jgi:formylglycine-generating enzyme required for sulfatase activity
MACLYWQVLKMLRIGLLSFILVFTVSCDRLDAGRQNPSAPSSADQSNKTSNAEMAVSSYNEPEMVLIGNGLFMMGSDGISGAEKPIHGVYLDKYYIGKFEVTNAQFKAFCDETGYPHPDAEWSPDGIRTAPDLSEKPLYPVVGINWEDAVAYCRWLSQKTGKNYRLPTEAEWEKAARGGIEGRNNPWGDEEYDAGGHYRANCGSDSDNDRIRNKDGFLYTAPVGSFPPNGYGLYDMAGNVWEWCADSYDENYYSRSPETNPRGPDSGEKRVLRGGSWFGGPARMQCAARLWNYPLIRYASTGFRVAMTQ